MIGIVEDLVAALYPRHFGPQGLSATEIDAFVAKTLKSALMALERQVRLELALEDEETGRRRGGRPKLLASFAAALPTVRALADSDVRAGFDGDPSATSIERSSSAFLASPRCSATGLRTNSTSSRCR